MCSNLDVVCQQLIKHCFKILCRLKTSGDWWFLGSFGPTLLPTDEEGGPAD